MPRVVGVICDGRVGREHVESLSGLQRRAGRIQSAAYVARRSGATVGAVFRRSLMNGSHGAKGAAIADARWKRLAFRMPESRGCKRRQPWRKYLWPQMRATPVRSADSPPQFQECQLDGAKSGNGSVTAWRGMPIEVAPRDIQVIGGRRAIGTALTGAGREKRQKRQDHRQGRGETQAFLHRGQHGVSSLRKPETNSYSLPSAPRSCDD
jgi:hypothetical protein